MLLDIQIDDLFISLYWELPPSINIQSFHPHSEILRGLEKHFESVDKIYMPDK